MAYKSYINLSGETVTPENEEQYQNFQKLGFKEATFKKDPNYVEPVTRYEDPNAKSEKDYYEGLDTTPDTEAEKENIRESTRQRMQAQIDAVDTYYQQLISGEEARGAERMKIGMGKTTAVANRAGILDSPMGKAQLENEAKEQQEYTTRNTKLLSAEQQLKKAAIYDRIDEKAEEQIQLDKEEAAGNYEKKEAWKTKTRNETRNTNIPTLAQTTALDIVKANRPLYDNLYKQGQFESELEFDSYYQEQEKNNAEKIDTTYKGPNGNSFIKRILIYPNGKRTTSDYDLGVPFSSESEDPKVIDGIPYNLVRDESGKVIKYEKIGGVEIKPKEPTDEEKTKGDWTKAKQFITDNPDATYEQLSTALRENAPKLTDSDISSLLKEAKKTEGGTFLSEEWFKTTYGESALIKQAKDAGYGKLFQGGKTEMANYLKDLMKGIEARRAAGLSDKEILEAMSK
jgi:hypothetical protein